MEVVGGPHSIARLDRQGCETIPPAQSLKRPEQERRDARDHGLHMEGSACGRAIGPEAAGKRMRVEISTHIDRIRDMDQWARDARWTGSHMNGPHVKWAAALWRAAGCGEAEKLCWRQSVSQEDTSHKLNKKTHQLQYPCNQSCSFLLQDGARKKSCETRQRRSTRTRRISRKFGES